MTGKGGQGSTPSRGSPLKFTPQPQNIPNVVNRGQAVKGNHNMDPFEVRVRFTQFLGNLNASVTSAQKTAQYAIKYRDMDEDLHNCIIEQLERVSKFYVFRGLANHYRMATL